MPNVFPWLILIYWIRFVFTIVTQRIVSLEIMSIIEITSLKILFNSELWSSKKRETDRKPDPIRTRKFYSKWTRTSKEICLHKKRKLDRKPDPGPTRIWTAITSIPSSLSWIFSNMTFRSTKTGSWTEKRTMDKPEKFVSKWTSTSV